MDWFNILKETKLVSSQGIRTKLGTTPLTMGDEEDDEDCCQQMKDFFIVNVEDLNIETFGSYNGSWNYILDMDCETFIQNAKRQYDNMHIIDDYSLKLKNVFGDSLLTYKWCNERTEN
tara:strand:+ start:156 stop:509 length:354 start_codon:yes stop_codon:yes gene_type:complete